MKDGNCVVRLKRMPAFAAAEPAAPAEGEPAQHKSGGWGDAFNRAVEEFDNPHAVADAIRATHTEAYIVHHDKILAAATRILGPPLPRNMHALSTFISPFDEPLNFHLDEHLREDMRVMRSIVLAGGAGCGKSARAFSEFLRPLQVNTVDDLRNIVLTGRRATTHLVFDEFNFDIFFSHVPLKDRLTMAINLIDCAESHTLKARNTDIVVPPLPRIFTTNKQMEWPHCHIFPAGTCAEEQQAVMRRFRTIRIDRPIWRTAADHEADSAKRKRLTQPQ